VYAASHDLKQPVNNLRGLFEELRDTATFNDPAAPHMWRMADDSLRVLATIITDLATVVQEERLPAPEAAEQVDLADVELSSNRLVFSAPAFTKITGA
jgi:signal transduction histidine kinase